MGVQPHLPDYLCVRAASGKSSSPPSIQTLTFFQAAPKYNYGAVCGIYFLSSLGLGGNIPIDATIALEFLPQNRRNLVSLLSLWQPIGTTAAAGIAYGTVAKYRCDTTLPSCHDVAAGAPCCSVSSNMGWRYEAIILGCITLLVFFLRFFVFNFYESPKFLISRGREQEAIDVLHKIAKFNKAPPPTLELEHFMAIDAIAPKAAEPPTRANAVRNVFRSLAHLKGLFLNKLQLFIFGILALAYIVCFSDQAPYNALTFLQGDYWSFNLAGAFLPIVLYRNKVSSGQSTVTDTYRQYIYIYLPGIIGAILAWFSVSLPILGRKWSLVFSAVCQGLAMAMYTQVKTTAGYVGLNALEYLMQTVSNKFRNHLANNQYFNAVLYASAPELFDTTYRGSASGMLSCLGRLAGIVAPFAGESFASKVFCRIADGTNRREVPHWQELRYPLAGCRRDLDGGVLLGVPPRGDEDAADVLGEECEYE